MAAASNSLQLLLISCDLETAARLLQLPYVRTRLVGEPMKPPSARHTRRVLRDTCAPHEQPLSWPSPRRDGVNERAEYQVSCQFLDARHSRDVSM